MCVRRGGSQKRYCLLRGIIACRGAESSAARVRVSATREEVDPPAQRVYVNLSTRRQMY